MIGTGLAGQENIDGLDQRLDEEIGHGVAGGRGGPRTPEPGRL